MDLSFIRNQKRDIVITFVTQFNDGFGYSEEGEQVFVPRTLMDKFMLQMEDIVRCKVVRNDPKFADRCPWRAYHVERLGNQNEIDINEEDLDLVPAWEPPKPDPETMVLEAIERAEMLSTAEVATLLNTDSSSARRLLDRLHRDRQVIRADIHVHADQTKASRIMWSCFDHIFQPLQEEAQKNG